MIRILLTIVFTAGIAVALHDLIQNGMWLQLAMLTASGCGIGMLLIYSLNDLEKE